MSGIPDTQICLAGWHLERIGAASAWAVTTGSPAVRVAVVDTGIDLGHPALAGRLLPGWDFDDGDPTPYPDPSLPGAGHGTACAGLIVAGAAGPVRGLAPSARVVPVRLQRPCSAARLERAVAWAGAAAEIVLYAWDRPAGDVVAETIHRLAKAGRGGRGVVFVSAAGSRGNPFLPFPASHPDTLAVGACTDDDRRAAYSDYGPGMDLLAPGSGGSLAIATTDLRNPRGYSAGAGYTSVAATGAAAFGGTSAAAALVAGAVALLLSVRPDLTLADVRGLLAATARRIDPARAGYDAFGWSVTHGAGCLDAGRAVQAALQNFDRRHTS